MKTVLKSVLLLMVAVLVSSCDLFSKVENVIPEIGGSMSAKLDGKDWKATTTLVIGKSTGGDLLSVGGTSITAKSTIGVNFNTKNGKIEEGKTYPCSPGSFAEITHDTEKSGYYETNNSGGTGSVKVTKWDGKTISGTFSGTLVEDDGKRKIVVTNGSFSGTLGII